VWCPADEDKPAHNASNKLVKTTVIECDHRQREVEKAAGELGPGITEDSYRRSCRVPCKDNTRCRTIRGALTTRRPERYLHLPLTLCSSECHNSRPCSGDSDILIMVDKKSSTGQEFSNGNNTAPQLRGTRPSRHAHSLPTILGPD
jgi:hypothetical protein